MKQYKGDLELNLCALCVLAVVKYQYSYGSYHLRIVFNTPLVAKCSVVIFIGKYFYELCTQKNIFTGWNY